MCAHAAVETTAQARKQEADEKDASRRFAEQRKIDSRKEHARSVEEDVSRAAGDEAIALS